MHSGSAYDGSEYGLFHFILDCYYIIQERGWLGEKDSEFIDILSSVKY